MSDSMSPASVIVEFKVLPVTYNIVHDEEVCTAVLRQMPSLIKALHIGARDPGKFHVLECLGLFEDIYAIGIIFKPLYQDRNRFRCQTLNVIIHNNRDDRLLAINFGNRVALATAVLELGKISFGNVGVHTRIFLSTISLFQDKEAEKGDGYSWDSPFLVGFELARHSLAISDQNQ